MQTDITSIFPQRRSISFPFTIYSMHSMYAQESNKNIVERTYSLRVTYYATVHHPPRFTQATKKKQKQQRIYILKLRMKT